MKGKLIHNCDEFLTIFDAFSYLLLLAGTAINRKMQG
jgi:hypothetical protein